MRPRASAFGRLRDAFDATLLPRRATPVTVDPALLGPWSLEEALRRVEWKLAECCVSAEPAVADGARNTVLAGGKRMRPKIVLLAYAACGGREYDRIVDAASAVELIHAASLVHDDIIDGSPLRRGRPTVHVTHGVATAICVGDFLFVRGFSLAGPLGLDVVDATSRACQRLAEGEVQEIRTARDGVATERDYLEIVTAKTAEPVRACAEVGAVLAEAPDAWRRALAGYALALGVAFQIQDDILDVEGDPSMLGKATGSDAHLPTLPRVAGLERARKAARWYHDQAVAELAPLPESPWKAELLALARQSVERDR